MIPAARVSAALALAAACAFVWPASRARADEAPQFGAPGQWLVGGSAGGVYEVSSMREGQGPSRFVDLTRLGFWLEPAAAYFVAPDLALGGALLLGSDHYDRSDDIDIDELSLGASALLAYRIGLGTRTFLLPRLTLGYEHVERTVSLDGTPSAFDGFGPALTARALQEALGTVGALRANLFVPVAFAPASGVFFGLGPYLEGAFALSGALAPGAQDWSLAVGLASIIGFWL